MDNNEIRDILKSIIMINKSNGLPQITIPDNLEENFLKRVNGNPMIVKLFLLEILTKVSSDYTVTIQDINKIISDIHVYMIQILFQYYNFEWLDEHQFIAMAGFLHFLSNMNFISLGFAKYIINSNNLLKESINILKIPTYENKIPLFNMDETGLLRPFHNILREAIDVLVINPFLVNQDTNVSSSTRRIMDKWFLNSTIDISQIKDYSYNNFLSAYQESINKCLENYQRIISDSLQKSQISNQILYEYLSVVRESSEKNIIELANVEKLIDILSRTNAISSNYTNHTHEQILLIMIKLSLFDNPKTQLKHWYLMLLRSQVPETRVIAWLNIDKLISERIINSFDLIGIKPQILSLLEDEKREIGQWGWIAVKKLMGYHIIDNEDREIFLHLLSHEVISIRVMAWEYVIYLLDIYKIISLDDVKAVKDKLISTIKYKWRQSNCLANYKQSSG